MICMLYVYYRPVSITFLIEHNVHSIQPRCVHNYTFICKAVTTSIDVFSLWCRLTPRSMGASTSPVDSPPTQQCMKEKV